MSDGGNSAAIEIAERLGEFGARIGNLEQSSRESSREMRDGLKNIEQRMAQPNQQGVEIGNLAQAIHRMVDAQQKAPPPAAPVHDESMLERMVDKALAARRQGPPTAMWVLSLIGVAFIVWWLRGLLPGFHL